MGDWFFDGTVLVVRVSKMSDIRYTIAVAVHELVEAVLCTQNGVTPEAVDAFDMGPGADYDEPGKHPSAPYHKEHIEATSIERKLITRLGVPWDIYDKAVGDQGEVNNGNETANA